MPGSPSVGKGATIEEALGNLLVCYQHDLGIEIEIDGTANQVPRVLRALGILRYSPELAAKVDGHVPLPQASAEERAIRSATILACEEIARHVGGTASDVDNVLWQSQDAAGDARFHLTETTWY